MSWGIRAVLAGQRNGGQFRRLALEKRGEPRRRLAAAREQELIGIGTITAGMLGLLAFTLSLTINIAQNRYETRRGLVLQEANSVQAAWLRSKLIGGERGPPVTALIARKTALEAQIWHTMRVLSRGSRPTRRRAWSWY